MTPSIRPVVKTCSQCRHFKPNGRCKVFVATSPSGTASMKAEHARDDPFLCGPSGLYFSDKNDTNSVLK
jgi:hypothetical protein